RHMCPVPPQDAVPSQVAGPQGRNPGPLLDLEPPMTTTWSSLPRAARDIAPRSAGPDGPGSGFDRNARRDGVDDPDITRSLTSTPRSRPPAIQTVVTLGLPYDAESRFLLCRCSRPASAVPRRER